MSIECGECDRDLRAGHAPTCSRYEPPELTPRQELRLEDLIKHLDEWEAAAPGRLWLYGFKDKNICVFLRENDDQTDCCEDSFFDATWAAVEEIDRQRGIENGEVKEGTE